jgi:uncharacterized DUF497 family protein
MTGDRIYIGLVVVDPSVVQKLHEKHGITVADVQEALQWPARAEAVVDDDPEHGWRVLAYGTTADGREVFGVLLPEPDHDWERAETWRIKSARWL